MPRYKRTGECKRCGICCQRHYIIRGLNEETIIRSCIVRGMKRSEAEAKLKGLKGFVCPDLGWVKKNGKKLAVCEVYDKRPKRCRDFPKEPDVRTNKNCGYSFIEIAEEEECQDQKER